MHKQKFKLELYHIITKSLQGKVLLWAHIRLCVLAFLPLIPLVVSGP